MGNYQSLYPTRARELPYIRFFAELDDAEPYLEVVKKNYFCYTIKTTTVCGQTTTFEIRETPVGIQKIIIKYVSSYINANNKQLWMTSNMMPCIYPNTVDKDTMQAFEDNLDFLISTLGYKIDILVVQ